MQYSFDILSFRGPGGDARWSNARGRCGGRLDYRAAVLTVLYCIFNLSVVGEHLPPRTARKPRLYPVWLASPVGLAPKRPRIGRGGLFSFVNANTISLMVSPDTIVHFSRRCL